MDKPRIDRIEVPDRDNLPRIVRTTLEALERAEKADPGCTSRRSNSEKGAKAAWKLR